MEVLYYCTYDSKEVGKLYIVTNGSAIVNIDMTDEDWEAFKSKNVVTFDNHSSLSIEIQKQFHEYFNGERRDFDIPLKFKGTMFQENVWKALLTIPYGKTWSYLDVATNIGKPKACRAVGQANRKNPIPIIIPCHRVIGKNQSLTGYAGTRIDVKEKLLFIEGFTDFKK
jgi:methylated-DNA-[protein]-cysteine S-methyltransferase